MEKIPRQESCICISLKFGSIVSGLVIILHSVLELASCISTLSDLPPQSELPAVASYIAVVLVAVANAVTLLISTVMLVGVIKENPRLIRYWVVWMSAMVSVQLLVFIFWTTLNMINHFSDTTMLTYALEFLTILLRFYMLTLVASYMKQLLERGDETERLKNIEIEDTWYSAV